MGQTIWRVFLYGRILLVQFCSFNWTPQCCKQGETGRGQTRKILNTNSSSAELRSRLRVSESDHGVCLALLLRNLCFFYIFFLNVKVGGNWVTSRYIMWVAFMRMSQASKPRFRNWQIHCKCIATVVKFMTTLKWGNWQEQIWTRQEDPFLIVSDWYWLPPLLSYSPDK